MRNEELASRSVFHSSFFISHSSFYDMHTLALDIGNTAVKAGAFDGSLLREMTAGLTAQQVRKLVQRWQPLHVVVASVAEAAVLVVEDLRDLVPGEILAFSPATTLVPLRNAYATPHSLGCRC